MTNQKIWITYFLLALNCSFVAEAQYNTIEWIDLLPSDDLEALLNPPEYLTEIEDGSPEDSIQSRLKNKVNTNVNDRYQQALQSEKIVATMNGKKIRIPGL